MADKILLSTYVITVEEKKVPLNLDKLYEDENFIELFESFSMNIMKDPFIPKSKGIFTDKSLTVPSAEILNNRLPFNIDASNNAIYGYFQAGTGGDNFDIMNNSTNVREFSVNSNKHISTKNVFYYLQVPPNSTEGFLVLQKIKNFGIKTDLNNALQIRLKDKLPKGVLVKLHNRVPYDLYKEMIQYGTLKKVEFIKNTVPANMKDFIANNQHARRVKGTMTHTMKMRGGFTSEWLKDAADILRGNNTKNHRIDFDEENAYFDEATFEIELDGKKKTFHTINKNKIQPSVDVTGDVEFDKNKQPTIESLIKVSQELIQDIINLKPKNV
ncbi:hypothetical protein [Aureispira sp. CCB-E]|uniref:hypothetical protein n=1 Tax=Aureispira sp. CCB-E TaxID=3051121 RepID=UPI0028695BCC|nr:hypothetical protein [Aureispira sp. CCB-E]WMX12425.1 hypothetical protein QP953_16470 [Aureispira sp. CCB-E]